MHAIVQVPFVDDVWRWVLYQFTMLLPMLLLSLIAASTTAGLPLVLASAAIFIDAYKFTVELTKLVDDPSMRTLVTFVVLGVVGMGVVFAGLLYSKFQADISDAVDSFAARACGPCRKPPARGDGEDPLSPATVATAEGKAAAQEDPEKGTESAKEVSQTI